MDSLTHIAIGACIGEAFFEKGFGKKAMLWGALSQSIPDIDFVSQLWLNDAEALLAHRGFTHSILFVLLATPLFAFTAESFHRKQGARLQKWMVFFFIQLLLHLLLDALNNYGVGWLEPFSHRRYAFNIVYVIDPFFSFVPWIATVGLIFMKEDNAHRSYWWKAAIFTFFIYLFFSFYNKIQINKMVATSIQKQHLHPTRYFTTPAPLQNILWYIVLETDQGYFISYKSLLEKDQEIRYHYVKKNIQAIKNVMDHTEVQELIRFSNNYYTIDSTKDGLIFCDLRFGQIKGWLNENGDFVFRYNLNHNADNSIVIQRGRIYGWNFNTLVQYFHRVFQF